jgi:hypothetical protein
VQHWLAMLAKLFKTRYGTSDSRDFPVPSNIMKFEILVYISLGIEIIIASVAFNDLENENRIYLVAVYVDYLMDFLFKFFLTWLSARRRKRLARNIFALWYAFGIFLVIASAGELSFISALTLMQVFLEGAAVYFVFSGNAQDWFTHLPISQLTN